VVLQMVISPLNKHGYYYLKLNYKTMIHFLKGGGSKREEMCVFDLGDLQNTRNLFGNCHF